LEAGPYLIEEESLQGGEEMVWMRLAVIFLVVMAWGAWGECVWAAPVSDVVKSVLRSRDLTGKNILVNPGLEGIGGWRAYEEGFDLDRDVAHSGQASARCANPGLSGRRGIAQTLLLNQKTPRAVVAGGWSKAQGVDAKREGDYAVGSGDYSVYVDITYTDGTPLWGQVAPFSGGTHGWEFRKVVIYPTKPVRDITVYGLFRNHSGTVWFDDFYLAEIPEGSTFDGAAILKDVAVSPQPGRVFLSTSDGLRVGLTQEGSVGSLICDGREMAQAGVASGFFARDMASESDFHRLIGKVTANVRSARLRGNIPDLHLKLDVTFKEQARAIRVEGQIEDTTGGDRAISLYFVLPVEARGGRWWDDIRQARRIDGRSEYLNAAGCGAGAIGRINLYPFAALTHGANLSLAAPMDRPRLYRIAYHARARQYYIVYDFGLTPESERFPRKATFSFLIYRSDPAWGFRAAARKYYELFPAFFVKRVRKEGIWMPFTDIATVREPLDFGFMFHEGNNNVRFDDRIGVYSFRYTEPMSYWMAMGKEVPRTHEGVMEQLKANMESSSEETRHMARCVQVSGAKDEKGRYIYSIQNAPWCDGAVFTLNNNPILPDTPEWPNRAHVAWSKEIADRLYNDTSGGILDGEYLDSLEGWGTLQNYNREHFRYAQLPLTFSTETQKPILLQAFCTYEFTRWMAEEVHRRRKLMMANGTPWTFTFYAHLLDVMGTETNWIYNNEWHPEGDQIMNLRRTICYQKPYLLLMNTNYDQMGVDRVERYFKRCLFYGIFPGMFSHNAADDPYWRNPRWYERDRHLFRRYIPVIKKIAQAGWEPITHARSSNPGIWVERWGDGNQGKVYLTVFNPGKETLTGRIQVEAGALLLKGKAKALLPEGSQMKVSRSGQRMNIAVTLKGEDVAVMEVE